MPNSSSSGAGGISANGMLFANFNQDFSCISVGTRKGYSVINCDPFGRIYTQNDGAKGIVEMLFCTSLIALVGAADQPQSSPRKLQIVNTKRQSMICELLFPSSILAVKMNRKTLVIILETEIYIYDISNMRLLHVIETASNPEAICALSPSADNSYLAYPSPVPSPSSATPGSSSSTTTTTTTPTPTPSSSSTSTHTQSGDVLLFSTRSLTVSNVIQAHKSPISCLALNSTGTLLATASEKGTVIRVWSVPGAERLYQFRRGTRESKIWSMCFNSVSSLLVVGGGRGSVHVFKLGSGGGSLSPKKNGNNGTLPSSPSESESVDSDGPPGDGSFDAFVEQKRGKDSALTRGSSLRKSITKSLSSSLGAMTIGDYLPNTLTEMFEPLRDFAFLKVPIVGNGNGRCVVGISGTIPQIMVLSSEGYFYSYSIDLEKGGECVLVKTSTLTDSDDSALDKD